MPMFIESVTSSSLASWSFEVPECSMFEMGVSKNRGTPKSSILIGFSIINHPFWGYHYFWKHPCLKCFFEYTSVRCHLIFFCLENPRFPHVGWKQIHGFLDVPLIGNWGGFFGAAIIDGYIYIPATPNNHL